MPLIQALQNTSQLHFPIAKNYKKEEGNYLQEGVQWEIKEKILSSDAEECYILQMPF